MSLLTLAWQRFIGLRFLMVGGFNFVASYLIFAGLYAVLHRALHDQAILVVSFVAGITLSFVTHRWLTYRSHGVWWAEYLRFYVVYGGQLVLNMILFWVAVDLLAWDAYLSQFGISVLLTVASFWGHRLFSFRGTA